jgi:cytochrome c553
MKRSVLLVAGMLSGCSSAPPPAPDAPTPVQQQMYVHFQDALDLRAGAIFGDNGVLIEAGVRLAAASSDPKLPAGSERFVRQMREAAAEATTATNDADRRKAAAEVARSCGSCHAAYRSGPDFVVGGPAPGESLRNHMSRQARISRLLWDGLIGPSQSTWAAGAAELAEEPPFPREIVARVQDERLLDDAQAELRALGARARETTDPMARSRLLSQVWGVCAGCHQVAGELGIDR